jgi:regulator of sirC expression with transglutaminase-like and TPR domain
MTPLSFSVPSPLEYFSALVQNDDELPLFEAAISIAQDEYPELDIQQVLGDVDQLLARIKRRLADDATHVQKLRLLNQFFFRELSFGGNINHYHDPDNSFINVVLRTRRGIPVTLALIWLELAQGLGIPAAGVAFPGHFMIKVSLAKGQVVIDPFTGQSLSREELSERLVPFQRDKQHAADQTELPLALFLHNAQPRDILMRVLGNLKEIHHAQNDWLRLSAVLDRMIVLQPEHWPSYRDRGLARAELSLHHLAVADLELYISHEPQAEDVELIAIRLQSLRRWT